jgi:hypothetical protein
MLCHAKRPRAKGGSFKRAYRKSQTGALTGIGIYFGDLVLLPSGLYCCLNEPLPPKFNLWIGSGWA